jgi:hypothetical protein
MLGTIPRLHLFLLQDDWVFFKEDDPTEAIIVLVGLGVVIVVAIIFRIFHRGIRPVSASKSRAGVPAPRKFNIFTLRRISKIYGLDHNQAKLLEYVFRIDSVSDPFRVMQNPNLLDRHFKRAYRAIVKNSRTDEDAQQTLEKLFSLRNTIEAGPDLDEVSPSHISDKTPAILATGKDSFPVRVINSRGKNVVVESPTNSLGTPVRLLKGAKVTLSFFTKSSSGFSLEGSILGPVHTDFGSGLKIAHTGNAKPLAKRKFRRRQTDTNTEFFFVNVVESGTGRKKTSKLVVDSKRFRGVVKDISAGGCSLKTSAPIPVGSRLKLVIDHDDSYLINVLGLVIRSNRSIHGTIIHIKFLKVPRRAFNTISAMVFGYDEV